MVAFQGGKAEDISQGEAGYKCIQEKMFDFCDVLDIAINNKTTIKKEEVSAKLFEFLKSPHATTDILLADKEKSQEAQKRKRKATTSKTKSSSEVEIW